MNAVNKNSGGFRLPILQGVLPIKASQIPLELIAGLTLAALAIPEVMGYTKIAGTPVITGLYTILIPMALFALFALFGSSRRADSATAAMLAAGLVALITTLMVVFVGVEQGILLAIALSLIDHTRRGYHPKNALLMPTESGEWEPQAVASQAQAAPGLMIYRFTHSMYYANSQQLSEEVTNLVNSAQPPLRWFCLDASAVDDVDYSAAETLRALHGILHEKGIRLVVAQVMEDVRDKSRYELRQLFGEDAFFDTLGDVMQAYQAQKL